MAHPNERLFLKRFLIQSPPDKWLKSLDSGRVLNLGSATLPHSIDYKPFFPGREVVGVDLAPGPGVDVVCDMEGNCEALKGERFAVVLCCSVLEHCPQPWLVAKNIVSHLMPAGLLYVTVPWSWRYHGYPKDYYRFSADAIRFLFPLIRWKSVAMGTHKDGEFVDPSKVTDQYPWLHKQDGRTYNASSMLYMIGRL